MKYRVIWYEGFGEHDFIEASRAEYGSLPELFEGLRGTVPDNELFTALDSGRMDAIHWVRDDLGFELERMN